MSAGKIPSELEGIFGSIPSGLIPINGSPVIFRIIDKLIGEGFSKISITVGYKKNNLIRILEQHYKNKIKLDFITTDHTKAPGNSIVKSLHDVSDDGLLIILGDTLVEDRLAELIRDNKDFVLTSKNFINSESWCLVRQKNNTVDSIYDKKLDLRGSDLHALIGIYFFSNSKILADLTKSLNPNETIEISHLLKLYKKQFSIATIESKQWFDVGHKNTYYTSKKKLLQSRFFNYLEFDEVKNIVTKTSDNKTKLINEIKWYQSIPDDIKSLIPNILEYSYSDNPYIKLQHIAAPTLAELWLYGDLQYDIWKNIFKQIFYIINLFKNHTNSVLQKDYKQIYVDKTEQRISNLVSTSKEFMVLFQSDTININGKLYTNWNNLKEKIYQKTEQLFNSTDNCIIHGDLCFSNILYDLNNDTCKIIDPRGTWGADVYGDIKYDIAKLRHSVVGGYDAIVNGLFSIEHKTNSMIEMDVFRPENYERVTTYFDDYVGSRWNLNQIKMIEGLLFVSMIPLHQDSFEKQLALYSVGIQRLNEIIDAV